MKHTNIISFILFSIFTNNAAAEKMICIPDTLMKITKSYTTTGQVRQTSNNTQIISISKNSITVLYGRDKLKFDKIMSNIYASGYGVIMLHPENDLRMVVNMYKSVDSGKDINIETIVYDCNTL